MSLSGLQDLFGTLTVGLLCILLVAEAYRLATGIPLTRRKPLSLPNEIHGLILPAVLLLGVYMIGTVTETFTDQLVDSDREKQLIWPPSLHSETYHRVGTLFKNLEDQSCKFNGQEDNSRKLSLNPTTIGKAVLLHDEHLSRVRMKGELLYLSNLVAEAKKFDQTYAGKGTKGKGAGAEPGMTLSVSCDTLGRSINALYYIAKNWSYSQDNYFNELQAIQRRIDFLRSIYLILGWLGALVLIGGTVGAWRARELSPWPTIHRALIGLGGVILLAFATHSGWGRAEINFNERAWGYFLTELDLKAGAEKDSEKCVPCEEEDEEDGEPREGAANQRLQRTADAAR